MIDPKPLVTIAAAAHESVRLYTLTQGDQSYDHWEQASQARKLVSCEMATAVVAGTFTGDAIVDVLFQATALAMARALGFAV